MTAMAPLTPRPITDYVPVEPAPKGVDIIHWEKDAAEDAEDHQHQRQLDAGADEQRLEQVVAEGHHQAPGHHEPEGRAHAGG